MISFGDNPSANESKITATLIRVPWMHGSPPHTSDFTTTRFKSFLYALSVNFLELRRGSSRQFYRIQPVVTIVKETVTAPSRKQA